LGQFPWSQPLHIPIWEVYFPFEPSAPPPAHRHAH
jgi:hypothetical protein